MSAISCGCVDLLVRVVGGCEKSGVRFFARELDVLLADVLARLPDDYREVIILRHLEGLSHDEISRRLNRSPGAVRMLWVRALAHLKSQLEQCSLS